MERLDRAFEKLLRHHNFAFLEAHSGAIYGVWDNFRLAYLNPGWFRFAKENDGEPRISKEWGLGRSILDCVSGDVKVLYQTKLNACLNTSEVWSHQYECSSDTVYRCFHQLVYPLVRRGGLIIVNSLVIEELHDPSKRQAMAADESVYIDENGFICQCAYCRRVKNYSVAERWDWVPEWVRRCPDNTSHTFCPACFAHYFPMATTDA
ncbi:hypothetical protein Q9L42_001090 [Methylomarinum sp. Ch1-1]|uniref:Uncharacterized protein n=1 Tax=Methylomarinum roseum TaxID=3067653 RepID=A0AAU7NUU1_9GAMM|nr:hypothetical protein [Methylomarinum sp. Ch1-1]MDP4519148.1 hypothetical protein [Methylomarinum sp. Ch1-1]